MRIMLKATKLTAGERDLIALWKAKGMSIRSIADKLNRSSSTICDEIHRNLYEGEYYIANYAQKKTEERRSIANKKNPLKGREVIHYVENRLRDGWTPELISGRSKLLFPEDNSWWISGEAIYQYVYRKENEDLGLWEYLPRGHKRRRKKRGRKVHSERIKNRVSIDKRGKLANQRKVFGHWEGDTVEGKGHKDGLHTEVERKTRFLMVKKVKSISSKESIKQQRGMFMKLPRKARRSTTMDNGRENHNHMELVDKLKMKTYFCDPYSSWQKGTNEWHNGIIRRYFPKGTDFKQVSDEEIKLVVKEINDRPKKVLGFMTPDELFRYNLVRINQSVRI